MSLNPDEEVRVEALFQAAADLSRAEREAFLDREAGDEPPLLERVRQLLQHLERGDSIPAPGRDPTPSATGVEEGPGTRIGRYKLLQEIGQGGYGVVYMAEQTEPVRRQVALKVIKLGMDTREVVARFEAERQALALMDHPNIARVLDGGSTDSGRPYFVMELVRGVSITRYCDENKLGTRERLELFVQVCRAVQHAHQKGVIHRDIKPSNVMVTLADGVAVPKVIDFGIAKAMHTRLTEKTLFTAYQRFIGTPAYMSPEQAEMSALDIDTRTDIYSLGVLLYELLTGSTPFDTTRLFEVGLAEIQRVLREEEPQLPSQRISTSQDATVAAARGLELRSLSRLLRGELDWIVLKSLEKDRARRYASASELADDVVRHLEDEPVLAGPPSAAYRARKFLSKHRTAVGWAGVFVLALLAGIVGTSLAMVEAGRQRDGARREADRARTVTDFLVEVLALTDPRTALQPDLPVRVLLDRAAGRLPSVFVGDPLAEGRVRLTIGRAYAALGEMEQAEAHLRRGAALVGDLEGFDQGELYAGLWRLTHVLFYLERPDALATAQWARRVAHRHVAERFPRLAEVFDAFVQAVDEGVHLHDDSGMRAARPLFEETVRLSDELLPPGDPLWPLLAGSYQHAGFDMWYSPHEPHSVAYWERCLTIQRRELPAGDPEISQTLVQLTSVLNRTGELAAAEGHIRESLDMLARTLPDANVQVAQAKALLGENLVRQGRYGEAQPLLLESHRLFDEGTPTLTFYLADSYARVIALYAGWDREPEAERYREELTRRLNETELRQPWPILRAIYGPDHAELRELCDQLDGICGSIIYPVAVGRLSDPRLLPLVRQVVETRRRTLPDRHPLAIETVRTLLHWSHELDPLAERAALDLVHEEAIRNLPALRERAPLDYAECLAGGALRLGRGGDDAGARTLAREALALAKPGEGDAWFVAAAKARIARQLIELGMFAEAEPLLLGVHAVFREHLTAAHSKTEVVRALLHELYTAWGRPEEARRFLPTSPTPEPEPENAR